MTQEIVDKLREEFIAELFNYKEARSIEVPSALYKLIDIAIWQSERITIDGLPPYEAVSPHQFHCYIYRRLKIFFQTCLRIRPLKVPAIQHRESLNVEEVFVQRQQIENLFSEVDSLELFEDSDLPIP